MLQHCPYSFGLGYFSKTVLLPRVNQIKQLEGRWVVTMLSWLPSQISCNISPLIETNRPALSSQPQTCLVKMSSDNRELE
jgi:hypothetical protein